VKNLLAGMLALSMAAAAQADFVGPLPRPPVARSVPKKAKAKAALLLSLPAEARGRASAFIRVAAETDCKAVRWMALDEGLEVFPPELLKDSRTAVVIASRPGRYRLLAYAARGDEPSEPAVCLVVVGDPPLPVPPPAPPAPPDDALAAAFRAAAALDRDEGKADLLGRLAAVYRQAGAETSSRAEVPTWGVLLSVVAEAARMRVGDPASVLKETRRAVSLHLKSVLPAEPGKALDAEGRRLAAASFARVAAALEAAR